MLYGGDTVTMSQLQVGDRVQTGTISVSKLQLGNKVSSPTNACWQVRGREQPGYHAGWQEISRCRTTGEFQGMSNTCTSAMGK